MSVRIGERGRSAYRDSPRQGSGAAEVGFSLTGRRVILGELDFYSGNSPGAGDVRTADSLLMNLTMLPPYRAPKLLLVAASEVC